MNICTSYLFIGYDFHIKNFPFQNVTKPCFQSCRVKKKKMRVMLWEKAQRGGKALHRLNIPKDPSGQDIQKCTPFIKVV